jgi:hypothetical protein
MNVLKVGVILGTLASAAMASLWVLGVVGGEEATETLKRILGVVVILTVALGAILLVTGKGKAGT